MIGILSIIALIMTIVGAIFFLLYAKWIILLFIVAIISYIIYRKYNPKPKGKKKGNWWVVGIFGLLFLFDLFIADPIPFIDEAILLFLTLNEMRGVIK